MQLWSFTGSYSWNYKKKRYKSTHVGKEQEDLKTVGEPIPAKLEVTTNLSRHCLYAQDYIEVLIIRKHHHRQTEAQKLADKLIFQDPNY